MSSEISRKLNLKYSHLNDITKGDQITISVNINSQQQLENISKDPREKNGLIFLSKEEENENDFHQPEFHLPLEMNTRPRGKPIKQ